LTGGGTLAIPAMLIYALYENSSAKFKMQNANTGIRI
jgi:hypothetical protein